MKRDFEYLVPETVEEACRLLSQWGEDAKVIAGGQSLLLFLKQGLISPGCLIDLKTSVSKELGYITADDQMLRIGALVTHREVENSSLVKKEMPILVEMEREVADVQIRNWGTIGGNLCQADPAGDPAPVLIALKAILKIKGPERERTVSIEDFFVDLYETVLHFDEVLTEIQVPKLPPRSGVAYQRLSFMRGERPTICTAVSVTLEPTDLVCSDVRIGIGAVGLTPFRAKRAEGGVKGNEINEALIKEVADIAAEEVEPSEDIHVSKEYKREMVKVLVRRAFQNALERAVRG
ncbi:MAG: xanthine dehydrogenase family protein subunit M [Deltaproteobacteria bacterium]|nr:MAG: xanthine dehydrogenase family protein subunit M [Deltaproteobacteria bacterium]